MFKIQAKETVATSPPSLPYTRLRSNPATVKFMGCMEKLAVVETLLSRICNQIKLGMWGVEAEASLPRNHPSRLFPLIWQKQHHWHSLVSCTTMVFSPCTHTKDSNVGHTRYLVCGPEMYLVEDAFWASSSTKMQHCIVHFFMIS